MSRENQALIWSIQRPQKSPEAPRVQAPVSSPPGRAPAAPQAAQPRTAMGTARHGSASRATPTPAPQPQLWHGWQGRRQVQVGAADLNTLPPPAAVQVRTNVAANVDTGPRATSAGPSVRSGGSHNSGSPPAPAPEWAPRVSPPGVLPEGYWELGSLGPGQCSEWEARRQKYLRQRAFSKAVTAMHMQRRAGSTGSPGRQLASASAPPARREPHEGTAASQNGDLVEQKRSSFDEGTRAALDRAAARDVAAALRL